MHTSLWCGRRTLLNTGSTTTVEIRNWTKLNFNKYLLLTNNIITLVITFVTKKGRKEKDNEKLLWEVKHLCMFDEEITCNSNINCCGSIRYCSLWVENYIQRIGVNIRVGHLKKTMLLGNAWILRKVLESWRCQLSSQVAKSWHLHYITSYTSTNSDIMRCTV